MDDSNILYVKNMVCPRCIMTVADILHREGIDTVYVTLGEVKTAEPVGRERREALKPLFESYGFELIDDRRMRMVERIRTSVIEYVHYTESGSRPVLSEFVASRCNRDYSSLSKLFSSARGMSIERYCILQKIERAKELLSYDELSVGEIADMLDYSSAAHFSAQFHEVTGMSPTAFRRSGRGTLRPLDGL